MGRVSSHLAFGVVENSKLSPLCQTLVEDQKLNLSDALATERSAKRLNIPLETVLEADYGLSESTICDALSTSYDVPVLHPLTDGPDPRLVAQYGTKNILKHHLLPWRQSGAFTVILCRSPQDFERHADSLFAYFGPVRMGLTTPKHIAAAVRKLRDPHLIHAAETQLNASESCREWDSAVSRRMCWLALVLGVSILAVAPAATLGIFCLLMTAILILNTVLKLAATIAGWRDAISPATSHAALPARLPSISVLVPLFKENDIAAHLIQRLSALQYPRALLDVCIILEAGDDTTKAAIEKASLPAWIRPVTVPHGTLKTKPRALNYALSFAKGRIIGIYDAEDAPAPNQLHVVAHHFANARQDVACLQGTLDYYNSTANWLTRCFTLEYASWFRVILPGFARLGLVVPLGGTTLFFRRAVLEKLGGWDAHNVTEDADLGVRLARYGYRTEFMRSVTEEEANGHALSWIKQRSRWLKGYAMTYAVHMRHPHKLLRDLGAWRFFGIQMLFLGTLLQFAFAPVIWSFWLIPLGVWHPLQAIVSSKMILSIGICFLAAGLTNFAIFAIGAKRAGKTKLALWVPTLQLYFPLAVVAVYKGLSEMLNKPFYWDKTPHGVLMPEAIQLPRPPLHQVSDERQTLH